MLMKIIKAGGYMMIFNELANQVNKIRHSRTKEKTMKFKKFILLLLFLVTIALTGCEKDGPVENAGEKIDNAIENTGEAIEEAGDKVKDATN